jgi:hypothetical protein
MASSNQLGIKEVLNLEIYNYATGVPLFYADYASNTSIESKAERLDLRGGQGNYKLLSFDHTKDMTMKMELPLVDLQFIATLTGRPLVIGTQNVPNRQVLLASAGNTITLASTPVSDTLKIYTLLGDRDVGVEQVAGTPASNVNEYSIASGTVVTLNATTAPSGTKFVASYKYASPVTTKRMTFSADRFAPYLRIIGTGIVSDQVEGQDYPTKFEVLKGKPKNDFTITMMSTEATKLDITIDLYSVDEINTGTGLIEKNYVNFYELV